MWLSVRPIVALQVWMLFVALAEGSGILLAAEFRTTDGKDSEAVSP